MNRKKISAIMFSFILFLTGCNKESRNEVSVLNQTIMFDSQNFEMLAKERKVVYVDNIGDAIKVKLKDDIPDNLKVTKSLLNKDGNPKYTEKVESSVSFKIEKDTFEFVFEPEDLYAISSENEDILKNSTYVGYTISNDKQTWYVLVGFQESK